MSKPIRVAVIGAGHLGKIHTRLIQQQPEVELVAVADPSPAAQREILGQVEVPVVSDYTRIIDQCDAAICATPTRFHFDIASNLLQAGKHVLVEKPLTDCVSDAQQLCRLAEETGCSVSVGHVERFNPAIRVALERVGQPRFIQAARMSGFTYRSTDIGVVHDLMIHDIDLVNAIFPGRVQSASAVGVGVIGQREDISQAMLQFDCGGVANLTASRCSFENERSFQVFGTEGYAKVDLAQSKVEFVQVPTWLQNRKYDLLDVTAEQQNFIREKLFSRILPKSQIDVPRCNAIEEEQKDWLQAIRTGQRPRVDVVQGTEAVDIADQVLRSIASNQWNQAAAATLSLFSPEQFDLPTVDADVPLTKAA